MEDIIKETMVSRKVIGIGSGKTIAKLIPYLPKSNVYVPASFASLCLLNQYELPTQHLKMTNSLDLYYDGADYIDKDENLLKGGGGCILKEKYMMSIAKSTVIIANKNKKVTLFDDKTVMIEIIPFMYGYIVDLFKKHNINAVLRESNGKNGPIVTENGNYIFDCVFTEKTLELIEKDKNILQNGYLDKKKYNFCIYYLKD